MGVYSVAEIQVLHIEMNGSGLKFLLTGALLAFFVGRAHDSCRWGCELGVEITKMIN